MKKILFTALILVAAVVGYSQYPTHAAKPSVKPAKIRTVPVTTADVGTKSMSQSLSLIGKLNAEQSVNIASETSAKVDEILVKANSNVKQGQLLIQLEDDKAKAVQIEAKAFLQDEIRILNEYRTLVTKGAITQTALDAQQASVDIAKARLAAAEAQLQDHYIRAPFAGTLGLIDFSRGELITTGEELFTLDNLSIMRLDLPVPARYLSQLHRGMDVTATTQAWPGIIFHGKISVIDTRIDPDSLNVRVRILFENKNNQLKPGMLMSSKARFAAETNVIIPAQALEYSGTKRFVYLVDQMNIANRTQVKLGARVDNQVVIEEGLKEGDRIVVQGLVNMRDGLKIKDLTQQSTLTTDSTSETDKPSKIDKSVVTDKAGNS
ncbi:efflux RND transporter periplasmic adaptor subunit [Vibrio sp. SS-MA-C1-2]|uniref:efflux RND transporter periplasmic adaptor subunit n=1 Tax=Vibrio sp. SS-MA-C1-2 TaxID=2908646 RepID=UPI001F28BC60|nr:efflux RND transporter periplasmic adaptor subunit [Vibrio sp. SS-MA-C1-2]UJF19869.1 efflux RND transporter periplasmic adaptor subunit [Vibrio sp. SS-MA-C1-2]